MPVLPDTVTRPRVAPAACIGQSALLRLVFGNADLTSLTNKLVARALSPVADPGAVMDLATILQSRGGLLAAEGLGLQRQAALVQPDYRVTHGKASGPRILAFVTPGDFMANTPIDFLLSGSDAVLLLHYVDAETRTLELPDHDVAFMAIGESQENAPVLANMARLLANFPGPIFNNAPALIASLTRDRVSALLASEPSIFAPRTHRLKRADIEAIAAGTRLATPTFPLVLRPAGTHAGQGMKRITDRQELSLWLSENPAAEAYAVPFIDYRGADGLYSKQRVVLIKGKPFASHMALSTHWMVHYLNADMAEYPDRRDAEARWMADFDRTFALRHARAFAALHRIFGLDYFGIDCAELPDGRLLVFEVDVAMIVHDMDEEAVYPYKKPAMQKLFAAFVAALDAAGRASHRP